MARALFKVMAKLNDLPPGEIVQWGDKQLTAGQILGVLQNTDFRFTDNSSFGNGGVGEARPGVNGGRNTVTMDYRFYDGDMSNNGSHGDYGASTYTNDAGLIGILMHDLGHLTSHGIDFNSKSNLYHRKQYGSDVSFAGYEYWENNESFVHSFSASLAAELNFDISQLSQHWQTTFIDPFTLYSANTSGSNGLLLDGEGEILHADPATLPQISADVMLI